MNPYNIKLAIRNLLKQRTGSIINIVGLTVSLSVCLLIALFVQYEFSFEKHNNNSKNVYRLLIASGGERTPIQPIAFYVKLTDAVPELRQGTMVQYEEEDFFMINNEKFMLKNTMFTNNNFFSLFKINMIKGSNLPFAAPNSVVISESEAQKLFPDGNVMGKTMKFDNQHDLEIRGVFKDVPATANFRPNVIMNIDLKKTIRSYEYESMDNSSTQFFFLLNNGANLKNIQDKILAQAKIAYSSKEIKAKYELQALSDIHLKSGDTTWDTIQRSDIKMVRTFIIISLLILLIATFNFINLSLALRNKRNFNTGIQKIMGANRNSLFSYLFAETSLLVGFCLIVAMFIVWLIIPAFNSLMGSALQLSLTNPMLWLAMLFIAVVNVFVPVVFQLFNRMRVNPVSSMRSKGRESGKSVFNTISQALTVSQIAISIALIIGVMVIDKQFYLLFSQKLGFDKSNLVTVYNPWDDNITGRFKLMKQEFERLPVVSGVTGTWNVPGENLNNGDRLTIKVNGEEKKIRVKRAPTGADFFKVMNTRFIMGSPYGIGDSAKLVVNRKCLEKLGIANPIGQKVSLKYGTNYEMEICGVIEDIQNSSLREETEPAVYFLKSELWSFIVRLQPGNLRSNMALLEATWNKFNPTLPFRYNFVDDVIRSNYKKEIRTQKLLTIMSVLAIMISMLGLLGLAMFNVQTRTKEIGIRKVNGAKITEVLSMLNKTYVKWVLIAFVIATPIAYYAMNKWLQTFVYKTAISWWIFALAGVLALAIALLTVSLQSWKAATKNPVEALRYE